VRSVNKATAAERIAELMRPGHPVRAADVARAGLPPGWARDISRASTAAADGTAALLSAHDLADRLTSTGKARAALALREMVRGSDRVTRRPAASEQDPVERKKRITARLDGVPLEEFDPSDPGGT
jgi:hypothetical protein